MDTAYQQQQGYATAPQFSCQICQAGGPGLPGMPGMDGLDGDDGQPGLMGEEGELGEYIHPPAMEDFCMSCPPAPAGLPGPPGRKVPLNKAMWKMFLGTSRSGR